MISIRDLARYTSLAQAVKDNTVSAVYNKKSPEKSFTGNAKAIRSNGVQWYRKRFQKQDCCNSRNTAFENGFAFCRKCGFLHV